jgi:hypothetical protein
MVTPTVVRGPTSPFWPFATAFVFGRNAMRAVAKARRNRSGVRLLIPPTLGFLINARGGVQGDNRQ